MVSRLTIVRLFIIYHDFQHGAIFRKSKLGKALMYWVGFLTLVVPSVWKETHDYHHRNNARLLGSAIGSYPLAGKSQLQTRAGVHCFGDGSRVSPSRR